MCKSHLLYYYIIGLISRYKGHHIQDQKCTQMTIDKTAPRWWCI